MTSKTVHARRGGRRRGAGQGELPFRQWGGAREGAGRPKVSDETVPHLARGALVARYPLHLTVRLCRGLPGLRNARTYWMLVERIRAGCGRFGFRLVEFSVQRDHLHLLVEAKDREALTRGMTGLLVRMARGLNKLWGRSGRVFAERFHERVLRSPTEVRRALVYVLQNAWHHRQRPRQPIDVYSSGPWFDGWREEVELSEPVMRPTVRPRTWLLKGGWRRSRGRLDFRERPA